MFQNIVIVKGDITLQDVDAIVNAANTGLLGGGGVDGAIHKAAGEKLLEECKALNGCRRGEAKITKGYNLPAKWVIHTVGPVWNDGKDNEDELLANCYKNSLKLAKEYGIRSIAFPSISTGAYRFPVDRASRIALREIRDFFNTNPTNPKKVVIVSFDDITYSAYLANMSEIFKQDNQGEIF